VKRRSRSEIRAVAPLYLQPLRWLAVVCVYVYHRIAYRIVRWGTLPRERGPSLIVANHQHEIESPVVVAELALQSLAWRDPIFTVSSRRMWEPGFFAERVPWLRVLRGSNLGWLFGSIGMQPIENELQARPYAGIAFMLTGLYGDLPLEQILNPRALAQLPPGVARISDVLDPRNFVFARSYLRIIDLLEPYRQAVLRATREQLDADIAHFEDLVRDGATIFLTPEGFYSGDGKMRPLRGILARLAPLATIWLVGISYDPYVRRRLSLLYRVFPARAGVAIDAQLKAGRPVTTSALLCTWLFERDGEFAPADAIAGVERLLRELPQTAFVAPELRRDPERAVRDALDGLRRYGRKHPEFPRTDDMIAYQFNFHAETLEGLRALR